MDGLELWGPCLLISVLSSPSLQDQGVKAPWNKAYQPCASMVSFRACLKHWLPREMSCRAGRETKKRKFHGICFFPLGKRYLWKSCGCKCECHHQEIATSPRVLVDSKEREAADLLPCPRSH